MSKNKFSLKQAISPIISILLLISITVIISLGTYNFLIDYVQDTQRTVENNAILDSLQIRSIFSDSEQSIIQTPFEQINISRVIYEGVECTNNRGVVSGKPLRVNMSSCAQASGQSSGTLTIESNEGVIQQNIQIDSFSGSTSGSETEGGSSFSAAFDACAFEDDKTGCESYYLTDTVDGINVVHDTSLGLYWEQSPSTTTRNWSSSQTHCSNLGSGWRLPTVVEMEASLVDVGRASSPYIVGGSGGGNLFDNIQSSSYWADTRYGSSLAYGVRFDSGISIADGVTNIYYALCVKEDSNYDVIWNTTQKYPYEGGLSQERVGGEFIEDATECGGSGTMYDTITNLCWEKNPSGSTYEHSQAQSHCSGVATAGGGWRLPEKAELMTLLYHDGFGSTNTRLNSIGFSGIQNSVYWSNTLSALNPSSGAYHVRFDVGYSLSRDVANSYYALCVKTAP